MTYEEIEKFNGKDVVLHCHKSGNLNVVNGRLRLQGPKKKSLCIYHGKACVFRARLLFDTEIAAVMKIEELIMIYSDPPWKK